VDFHHRAHITHNSNSSQVGSRSPRKGSYSDLGRNIWCLPWRRVKLFPDQSLCWQPKPKPTTPLQLHLRWIHHPFEPLRITWRTSSNPAYMMPLLAFTIKCKHNDESC